MTWHKMLTTIIGSEFPLGNQHHKVIRIQMLFYYFISQISVDLSPIWITSTITLNSTNQICFSKQVPSRSYYFRQSNTLSRLGLAQFIWSSWWSRWFSSPWPSLHQLSSFHIDRIKSTTNLDFMSLSIREPNSFKWSLLAQFWVL